MEKLYSHNFEAVIQLRSNKKQSDDSTVMSLLSEKLEGPNIDKENTAWKVSKYGVFSGPYFPAFGLNTERY